MAGDKLLGQAVEVAGHTARLFGEWQEIVGHPRLRPGSPADTSRVWASRVVGPEGAWPNDLMARLTERAYLYIVIAQQHLSGLADLVTSRNLNLACGTVARSVSEASCRAVWLLDNRLFTPEGTRQRVARLLLDEEEEARKAREVKEQLRLEGKKAARDLHRERRALLDEDVLFSGEDREEGECGERIILDQSMLGPTAMVIEANRIAGARAQDAAGIYGYLCAMTHPNLLALWEMMEFDEDELPVRGESGRIQLSYPSDFVALLLSNCVRDIHVSWRALANWTEASDHGLDDLRAQHIALSVAVEKERNQRLKFEGKS